VRLIRSDTPDQFQDKLDEIGDRCRFTGYLYALDDVTHELVDRMELGEQPPSYGDLLFLLRSRVEKVEAGGDNRLPIRE
jgi:hypothetical protein